MVATDYWKNRGNVRLCVVCKRVIEPSVPYVGWIARAEQIVRKTGQTLATNEQNVAAFHEMCYASVTPKLTEFLNGLGRP